MENKNYLYDKNIDNVIRSAKCKSSKSESTTIMIPLNHDEALKDLQDKYGKSATCVLRYTCQFGFSIFQHENKDSINEIKRLRKNLRHTRNQYIQTSLHQLVVNIGENSNKEKRNLSEEPNLLAAMKTLCRDLNIPFSAFIWILLNYAFRTAPRGTLEHIRSEAECSIIAFRKSIEDLLEFLTLLNGKNNDYCEEILLEEDDDRK